MKLLRDTWLIFSRQMTLLVRNPVWVIAGVIQPLFYVLLYAPLLPSALRVHGSGAAYATFIPGLLILLAIFASLYAGLGLIGEVRAGVIERFQVTPLSRVSLLLGRCARDVVTTALQAVIITGLALAFGLRANLGGLVLAFALLSLVALMLSAVSYGLALRLRSEEAMSPLVQTLSQPLILLSGVMLPLALAPTWMRRIADWNPLSYVVNAQRSLFAGDLGQRSLWEAALLIGVLTVGAVVWAARSFSRGLS